jgi:hypothetical protein
LICFLLSSHCDQTPWQLVDKQKFSDLIDLYQGKKMHGKALAMLHERVHIHFVSIQLRPVLPRRKMTSWTGIRLQSGIFRSSVLARWISSLTTQNGCWRKTRRSACR